MTTTAMPEPIAHVEDWPDDRTPIGLVWDVAPDSVPIGTKLYALATLQAQPAAHDIAEAIHYPDCWDQAAYPTLESALHELTAWFKCSNDECAQPAAVSDATINRVVYEHTKLNPNQADDLDLLLGFRNAVRAILALRPQAESEQAQELRRSLAEAQATISERNAEIIELQKRIRRSPQSESEARRAAQEQLYTERERHTAEVKRLQAEIGRLQSLRPQYSSPAAEPVGRAVDVDGEIRLIPYDDDPATSPLSDGSEVFCAPLKLNCKSVQKRLMAQWGYEVQPAREPMTDEVLSVLQAIHRRPSDVGIWLDDLTRVIRATRGMPMSMPSKAAPKLIGWRTSDYLMETADKSKADNWSVHHEMLPIFEGDPHTKLGSHGITAQGAQGGEA